MRRFLKSLILSLAVGVLTVMPVQAFGLKPGIQEFIADPGQTVRGTIDITNDEADAQTFYLTLQKFQAKGETGQQEFLPLTDTSGLPSWIYLAAPKFNLKPGEGKSVPFEIRIPKDTASGSYFAAIFFSTLPPSGVKGSVTGSRTGSLIFLTVRGTFVQARAGVKNISATPQRAAHLPVTFTLQIENQGNVFVKPQGYLRIHNMWGNSVARLKINAEGARLLPNSTRTFDATWQNNPPQNANGFWSEVKEEWRNFALGTYTVSFESEQSEFQNSASKTAEFSVMPWALFVLVIGGVLLVMATIIAWVCRRK